VIKSVFLWILSAIQILSFTAVRIGCTRTIGVNRYMTHQTFESFGTSTAWWAQNVDSDADAQQIARMLYGKNTGLGLEVFRYNVGAGEKENPDSVVTIESRKAESFYYFNEESGKWEYDFTRDANARRVLDYAMDFGVREVILFCNSPHYSMTKSGLASGGREEYVNNLPEENYQAFVDYLLTIADAFIDMGYPVTAISPINEPQWKWGGDYVSQEGCHYDVDECIKLLELFAVTMQERHCPYELRGPETGEMSPEYYQYIDRFMQSDILRNFCKYYSGHSYWMDNNYDGKTEVGKKFSCEYPDMKLEMSEWCELPLKIDSNTIDSGIYMANIIIQDLTLMNAVSWQSWTAVNEDGLMDFADGRLKTFNRYYAFMHFSRFIEPGAVRIDTMDSVDNKDIQSVAFMKDGKTVLVLVNSSEKDIKLELSGLGAGRYSVYRTDSTVNCEKVEEGCMLKIHKIPAKSIETVVVG
jgi:O-glycosyl hydrolase